MSTVLALDLGTNCGWAMKADGNPLKSGTWHLKPLQFETEAQRYVRFRDKLRAAIKAGVTHVVFEAVNFAVTTDAAHMYGGFRAILMVECTEAKIPMSSFGPGQIKKHATGKGNAKKQQMLETALTKWPDQNVSDDNQADALWLLDYLLENRK